MTYIEKDHNQRIIDLSNIDFSYIDSQSYTKLLNNIYFKNELGTVIDEKWIGYYYKPCDHQGVCS